MFLGESGLSILSIYLFLVRFHFILSPSIWCDLNALPLHHWVLIMLTFCKPPSGPHPKARKPASHQAWSPLSYLSSKGLLFQTQSVSLFEQLWKTAGRWSRCHSPPWVSRCISLQPPFFWFSHSESFNRYWCPVLPRASSLALMYHSTTCAVYFGNQPLTASSLNVSSPLRQLILTQRCPPSCSPRSQSLLGQPLGPLVAELKSAQQGAQLDALWPPRGVGWGGWEGGSRGRGYGDICIRIADSLCCTAETNTPL